MTPLLTIPLMVSNPYKPTAKKTTKKYLFETLNQEKNQLVSVTHNAGDKMLVTDLRPFISRVTHMYILYLPLAAVMSPYSV